ncbi:hypothetical protein [Virgibacillus sp. Bac332]|uniref:hypothetical protein n=1 Tax=Virgibacillus sp. Bac332 TaxID=2419842 RepID=UPI000EF4E5E9|nr:hypothetical protein [Virgibacillus sp. Bac332]
MLKHIEELDDLNDGRIKINESIDASNRAEAKSDEALSKSDTALSNSEATQTQLDTIIIESGTSDAETLQARTDANGVEHTTLKERADSDYTEVTTTLNTTQQEVSERELKNKLYKKSIFKQLPLQFPDYETIKNTTGASYLFPQSFTIDWTSNEIFILYSPTGGSVTKRWIIVYDLETSTYKSCFGASDSGGEGIVVKTETDGSRYLYVKTTGGNLGKFLLDVLPTNTETIDPIAEYDVGLFYEFAYNKGNWIIEQQGAALGNDIRRTNFFVYDDNFNKVNTFDISTSIGGTWVGDYINYLPKRQGIALGDEGLIYHYAGGHYKKGNPVNSYHSQGLTILNGRGEAILDGLVDPNKLMESLETRGVICDIIENEGVHYSPNGEVYSLNVHTDIHSADATGRGIVILKELSTDLNAMDLSNSGAVKKGFNPSVIETGVYPRSGDGNMYNPLNGQIFDSLDKILDFMKGTDTRSFSFYSSSTPVLDINGTQIPNSNLVQIYNANNNVFIVKYSSGSAVKHFHIYGQSGSRSQSEIFYDSGKVVLNLLNGITNFYTSYEANAKKTPTGNVILSGTLNDIPSTRPIKIATLPASYRPPISSTFPIALSASTAGGYGVIEIKYTGEINLVYTSSSVSYCSLNGITFQT